MSIRPFMLYGESELERAREAVTAALERWRRQWLLVGASAGVSGVSACEAGGRNRQRQGSGILSTHSDDRWCFFNVEPGRVAQLGALLLGADTLDPHRLEGSVASDLVVDALGELGQTLCGRIDEETGGEAIPSSLPVLASEPGSGCLGAGLRIGHERIDCILSPGAVGAFINRVPATERKVARGIGLTALREAIRGQKVRLHARLGVPELALDAVMTLREGDVIRLEEHLSEPSTLICGAATLGCSGYLGARDGQRAVRLTPVGPGMEN